ncbi:hypothetical protein ABZ442_20680 [Streptomyces triculaminicus]|uniref:hypothetical protein n=1 Tax=Streptomyces triculaminicus TaxID=2816232 RepID=UPI0033FCFD22
MTPAPPALVSVIGPVEPALLIAWTAHYRTLGITGFRLAFHFPDHVLSPWRHQLLATAAELGIAPVTVSAGPWHEHTNTELRDALREQAGPGWHLLADSDEFHTFPAPLEEVIATAEETGRAVVGGVMLDRAAADGRLAHWRPETGLDHVFPLGGHLTHRLLRGDPRKIVLAQPGIAVASGNHRAPGHKPDPDALACVHHFKWRAGVLEDLRRRVERFTCGGGWNGSPPASGPSRARPYGTRPGGYWTTSTGTTGASTSPTPAWSSAAWPWTVCRRAGRPRPAASSPGGGRLSRTATGSGARSARMGT